MPAFPVCYCDNHLWEDYFECELNNPQIQNKCQVFQKLGKSWDWVLLGLSIFSIFAKANRRLRKVKLQFDYQDDASWCTKVSQCFCRNGFRQGKIYNLIKISSVVIHFTFTLRKCLFWYNSFVVCGLGKLSIQSTRVVILLDADVQPVFGRNCELNGEYMINVREKSIIIYFIVCFSFSCLLLLLCLVQFWFCNFCGNEFWPISMSKPWNVVRKLRENFDPFELKTSCAFHWLKSYNKFPFRWTRSHREKWERNHDFRNH